MLLFFFIAIRGSSASWTISRKQAACLKVEEHKKNIRVIIKTNKMNEKKIVKINNNGNVSSKEIREFCSDILCLFFE